MKKRKDFENALMEALTKERIEAEIVIYGIRVKYGIDTWYIDIRQAKNQKAMIKLHHKDLISKSKTNYKRCIPDTHVQMTREMTIKEIISYIKKHEKKYHKTHKRKRCEL